MIIKDISYRFAKQLDVVRLDVHKLCAMNDAKNTTNVCVIIPLMALVFIYAMKIHQESTPDSILMVYNETHVGPGLLGPTYNGSHRRVQPCTHAIFRRYYREIGHLPTGGQWIDMDKSGVHVAYKSDVCSLKYAKLPPTFMKKCLSKANISSIVTLGDSNAQRYWNAMVQSIMKPFADNCRVVRSETLQKGGQVPDKRYFTRGHNNDILNHILTVHYSYCSGCGAGESVCFWKRPQNDVVHETSGQYKPRTSRLSVEHLPMTLVVPTSLRVLVPVDMHRQANHSLLSHQYFAQSSPEFFFKLYLSEHYPDIMLVFLPLNHVKFLALKRVEADMKFFHSLVKLYIPRTTKVFYMPGFMEFEEAKRKTIWKNKTIDGLLAWQRIEKLNNIMYDVIKDDVMNASSGIYSFFDLIDMSRDRSSWSTDGVHMKPIWYSTVMLHFWEMLCNGILLDK